MNLEESIKILERAVEDPLGVCLLDGDINEILLAITLEIKRQKERVDRIIEDRRRGSY